MIQDYYKKLAEGYKKENQNKSNDILVCDAIIDSYATILTDDLKIIEQLEKEVVFYKENFIKAFRFLLKILKANIFQKFMFVFFGKDINLDIVSRYKGRRVK